MKTREAIKEHAKLSFNKQYWLSVGVYALYGIITSILSSSTGGLASLLVVPPLLVGYTYFFLKIARDEPANIEESVKLGFYNYGRNLGGILWMQLFIMLWTMLFIIPGIIKSIAYSMTPYILADMDDVGATDALKLSMRMTDGFKGRIFVMYLSFIGWVLLSLMTFGILAIFYTGPYIQTSIAGLYIELKQNALEKGII